MTRVFDKHVSAVFDDNSKAKLDQVVEVKFPADGIPVATASSTA